MFLQKVFKYIYIIRDMINVSNTSPNANKINSKYISKHSLPKINSNLIKHLIISVNAKS